MVVERSVDQRNLSNGGMGRIGDASPHGDLLSVVYVAGGFRVSAQNRLSFGPMLSKM